MITIVSCWYNEEFLAPFFLKHYSWVDKIIILLDEETNDNTASIISGNDKIDVIPLLYPNGMDERLKVKAINEAYKTIRQGYVLNVDADEFVFCNREDIENAYYDVAKVTLINVYRHTSDKDLDSNIPVKEQRRHGCHSWPYMKPIIARAGLPLEWTVGNHAIKIMGKQEHYYTNGLDSSVRYRIDNFVGAHWANADHCFCVQRRIERRDRQSKLNLDRGYSLHNHGIQEGDIVKECKDHENDPEVF